MSDRFEGFGNIKEDNGRLLPRGTWRAVSNAIIASKLTKLHPQNLLVKTWFSAYDAAVHMELWDTGFPEDRFPVAEAQISEMECMERTNFHIVDTIVGRLMASLTVTYRSKEENPPINPPKTVDTWAEFDKKYDLEAA